MINKYTEIQFKIADISFKYIYEKPISISDMASINQFMGSFDNIDVINHISFAGHLDDIPGEANLRCITPAWSLYDYNSAVYVDFHPGNIRIAHMLVMDNGKSAYTKMINTDYNLFPLPICITGFLLQQQLDARKDGFIMHGATIDFKGNGIMLSGNSGVGKSTLGALVGAHTSGRRVTDDRVIIKSEEVFWAYGNPFDLKLDECSNIKTRIRMICLLRHGKVNSLRRHSTVDALHKLLTISLLPYGHKDNLQKSVQSLKEMAMSIPIYEYQFVPNESAVHYLMDEFERVLS